MSLFPKKKSHQHRTREGKRQMLMLKSEAIIEYAERLSIRNELVQYKLIECGYRKIKKQNFGI